MATRRFSANPGAATAVNAVTEAAGIAVVTSAVELTVDCGTGVITDGSTTRKPTKEEVLIALEAITAYIVQVQWPPV